MNESTLVQHEEMSDLDWLARNVHKWKSGYDLAAVQRGGGEIYVTWTSACSCGITKKQWLARRAELQNKPSFADHSDAKCFSQNGEGTWYKNIKSDNVSTTDNGEWRNNCMNGGWQMLGTGEILGDWRETLEKRPEQGDFVPFVSVEDAKISILQSDGDVKHFGGIIGRNLLPEEGEATAKQPVITTSKYTKTIRGVSVDVYDVLQAWGVSNPALQHLIKKALQCGKRGHKDNAQDLQDIIDSAIRAKELEC